MAVTPPPLHQSEDQSKPLAAARIFQDNKNAKPTGSGATASHPCERQQRGEMNTPGRIQTSNGGILLILLLGNNPAPPRIPAHGTPHRTLATYIGGKASGPAVNTLHNKGARGKIVSAHWRGACLLCSARLSRVNAHPRLPGT